MLNERNPVNLYVVDFGAELHSLIFFAPHYGANIGAVDAHDAMFHFLPVGQSLLLTIYLFES